MRYSTKLDHHYLYFQALVFSLIETHDQNYYNALNK